MGCMRLPVTPDGSIDEAKGFSLIDLCLELGVDYFDTGYMYHQRRSEDFLGAALSRYPRERYRIATKAKTSYCADAEGLEAMFREQQKKLRVDVIDHYMIHAVDRVQLPDFERLDLCAFLDAKKRAGEILYTGFSFHDTAPVLERVLDMYDWDFAQIQLNYVDWALDGGPLYRVLEKRGVPCIVMEPLRGGFLANPPEGAARILKEDDPAASCASWSFRHLTRLPGVKTILSGMNAPEQIRENAAAVCQKPLDERQAAVLERARQALWAGPAIPCTGCGYCVEADPCGVDIPRIFQLYNRRVLFREARRSRKTYLGSMDAQQRGDTCIACGRCAERCPQKIDIPGELARVHELLMMGE